MVDLNENTSRTKLKVHGAFVFGKILYSISLSGLEAFCVSLVCGLDMENKSETFFFSNTVMHCFHFMCLKQLSHKCCVAFLRFMLSNYNSFVVANQSKC